MNNPESHKFNTVRNFESLKIFGARDTELNQTDKIPIFLAAILVGETSNKYIKKERV